MKTVISAVLLNLALISVCYAETPAWSIAKLSKIQSYHTGANCLNAVLAAQGYVDLLTYTEDFEFKYYLMRFCQTSADADAPGSVLTVLQDRDIVHAAISLGNGLIFDKNSTFGLNAMKAPTRQQDAQYRSHARSESKYFANLCPSCSVKGYQCAPSSVVRPAMKECNNAAEKLGFTTIRRRLHALTFDTRNTVSIAPWDLVSLDFVSIQLRSLSGKEPCAPYLLVSAVSILRNFSNFRSHEEPIGKTSEDEADYEYLRRQNSRSFLFSEAEALKRRILSFDHSPNTVEFLTYVPFR